jgi:putative MATE family efflux protein
MSLFIGASMLGQTLSSLVDLYCVAGLGKHALAGVSAAGNVMVIVMALTPVLGVSTVTLIAHAVSRQDQHTAHGVFNQSLLLAALCTAGTVMAGYVLTGVSMRAIGADAGTVIAGKTYLYWFIPGMVLQFTIVAMGAALRGIGIVQPTTLVQVTTLALNSLLAPVLIAGWGTGYPLGVAGSALASTVSILLGPGLLALYFGHLETSGWFDRTLWWPHLAPWKRMRTSGRPASGACASIFVSHGVIDWCMQSFGATAQAGCGVGARVMPSIFVPAMAMAFAASLIAGQNFGARQAERVRETFRSAAFFRAGIMATLTMVCQWQPALLVRAFVGAPYIVDVGAAYLRIMSWNFVGIGLVLTCSGLLRAVGNTWPALASGAGRTLVFALTARWLAAQPQTRIEHFWYVSSRP